MKRLTFFLMYDPDGIVRDYIFYYLNELNRVSDRLIIVSNGEISRSSKRKIEECGYFLFERENIGFDVGAYKFLFDELGWDFVSGFDELLLCNSTTYGPIYDMNDFISVMNERDCDFWGLVRHPEQNNYLLPNQQGYIYEHIMSYFIAFRKSILNTEDFRDFWQYLPEIMKKEECVGYWETQITHYFENLGYKSDSFVNLSDYEGRCNNSSIFLPDDLLIKSGCPFVKRRAFFFPAFDNLLMNSNTGHSKNLIQYIESNSDYDVGLIWQDLLQTQKMSVLNNNMHLGEIISDTSASQLYSRNILFAIYLPKVEYFTILEEFLADITSRGQVILLCKYEIGQDIYGEVSNYNNVSIVYITGKQGAVSNECYKKISSGADTIDYFCVVFSYNVPERELSIGEEDYVRYIYSSLFFNGTYIDNIIDKFENDRFLGVLAPQETSFGAFYAYHQGRLNHGLIIRYKYIYDNIKIEIPFDDGIYTNGAGAFWLRDNVITEVLRKNKKYSRLLSTDNSIDFFIPMITQDAGYYTTTITTIENAELALDLSNYTKHKYVNKVQNEYKINAWTYYQNLNAKKPDKVITKNIYPSRESILDTHFSFKEILSIISKYSKHHKEYVRNKKESNKVKKVLARVYLNGVFIQGNRLIVYLWSTQEKLSEVYLSVGKKKYYSIKELNEGQESIKKYCQEYYFADAEFFQLPIEKICEHEVIKLYSLSGRHIPMAWGHGISYNAMELRSLGLCSRINFAGDYIIQDKNKFISEINASKEYSKKEKFIFNLIRINPFHKVNLFAENLGAADNTFQVFKTEAYKHRYNFYVCSKDMFNSEVNPKLKRKMVVHNSRKHHLLQAFSGKWIGSYSLALELLTTTGKFLDIYMNFIPAKWYLIPHGITVGDKEVSMLYSYNWGNPYMTFANSPVERDAFANIYGFKNVISLGSPRMDKWYGKQLNDNELIVFFTWRMGLANRGNHNFSDERSNYINCAVEVVKAIRETIANIHIYYVFHHEVVRAGIDKEIKEAIFENNIDNVSYIDFTNAIGAREFNKHFASAKWLVTDFSSVAYDFAYKKDAKVIYYLQEDFIAHHYPLKQDFFDIHLGVVAKNIDELKNELLQNEISMWEVSRRKKFFYADDANNSSRVYEAIVSDGIVGENVVISNKQDALLNNSDSRGNISKRLNIFFLYDKDGVVDDYIYYYLEKLTPLFQENCVVINGSIKSEYLERLDKLVDKVIIRENEGFDSWAYKDAIESYGYDYLENEVDELLLNNFTNFGPFYPFEEMFESMEKRECDFWGHNRYLPELNQKFDGLPMEEHLQSYFIVFRKRILQSEYFKKYWKTLKKPRDYMDAVKFHELRCTAYFEKLGFISNAVIPEYVYPPYCWNTPVYMAYPLIKDYRSSLIKRKAFMIEEQKFRFPFFSNETVYDLIDYIKQYTDYDTDLILQNMKRTMDITGATSNEEIADINIRISQMEKNGSRRELINREKNKIYSENELLKHFMA